MEKSNECYKSKNMNYVFNVEYFSELYNNPYSEMKNIRLDNNNRNIEKFYFDEINPDLEYEGVEGYQSFSLYTMYPGLLIGTGNLHEISNKDAVKLGFSFDYVTGAPYIPGSSLKGMLRSCFKMKELIQTIMDDLYNKGNVDVKKLEENMFDYGDIFIGGAPYAKGNLLNMDYITPHKKETSNPVPLRMVKVRPGIKFVFSFALEDYVENGEVLVTADEKLGLCKELIKLMGIGAKTNTGYGRFSECEVK